MKLHLYIVFALFTNLAVGADLDTPIDDPGAMDSHLRSGDDLTTAISNVTSLVRGAGNCNSSSEQCAAVIGAKIARAEAKLSLGLAKSLGAFAGEDERLAKSEEDQRKKIEDIQRQIQRNAQARNENANQPTPDTGSGNSSGGNSSGGNKGGGKGGGPKGGGGGGAGGSPAQSQLPSAKNPELTKAGDTAAPQGLDSQGLDFSNNRRDYQGPNFDQSPLVTGAFQPSLTGSPNRAAATSVDRGGLTNFAGSGGYRPSGQQSALPGIQDKPAAQTAAAAEKPAGAAPGLGGGGGAPGGGGGGPPPVDGQELEPGPPPPKKVSVEYAAAGGGGAEGGGSENGGESDGESTGKPGQVAPPRSQALLAAAAGNGGKREKRSGHGVLDYVGFIGDSCHENGEALLSAVCKRGKSPAAPIIGGVAPADTERALASATDSKAPSTDLALAPSNAAVGGQFPAKFDPQLVKDGLQRVFSRSLPDQAL